MTDIVLDCDFPMPESVLRKRLKNGRVIYGESAVEKWCSRCDEYHPLTTEFWHRDATTSDGAWYMCKACEAERKGRV